MSLHHVVKAMWRPLFADNSRAVQELGWTPQYGLEDMLADSWNWQKQNPNGYRQDE